MPDTCLDMTSHFQEIHGDSPICRHSRNIGTNYEHNYEDASGIYMKIGLLNIGRSDMKQKANNPVRSMLSYPFTFVGFLAHTFFGVAIVFGCITHRFVVAHLHQGPYTKVHTPSYFWWFKCPYTCLFLYRKQLKMSTFLVTYIRKNPFELSNVLSFSSSSCGLSCALFYIISYALR